ncbi:peptidase U32 family protein [Paenibacillus sp. 1P07SE]|uniref:peptidase U32 family protein n=1 Tax=Paenibacillus sp. 1P07SE TaxID=3132209 RepID=UPI0039A4DE11
MSKTELLCTAASLEEMERLIAAGADAFVIGEPRFGMRLPGAFSPAQIAEAVRLAAPQGVRIYVSINNLIENEQLQELPGYIDAVAAAGAHAIVFGDPAVLMGVQASHPELALHWNAEMTSTNYATADFWGRRGAARAVLARELNMEQITEFKQHTKLQVEVQVHGMTNIYHSKRYLLQSYADHNRQIRPSGLPAGQLVSGQEQGLYLMEAERPEERFPIFEDVNGTHVMSSDDICMLENLHELLEAGVDSLKIEGFMKPIIYNETVVRAYRQAIDSYYTDPAGYAFDEAALEPIRELQDPHRELSFGFFYKEQVY